MNIAVLSDNFLTDDHKQRLSSLGNVTYYADTNTEDKTIQRLQKIEAAIVDIYVTPLTPKVLQSTSMLKYITINSTGYDLLDTDLLKQHGIQASNNVNFSTDSVAEHTFALLFAVLRHVPFFDTQIRQHPFEMSDPAEYAPLATMNLKGKTLGIIGLGAIGQRVAQIGQVFGMKVIAYNRSPKLITGVNQVSLPELLSSSDVVSLHLPLTPETKYLIGTSELNNMKPTAVLINTARAQLVDNQALAEAIQSHQIYGAGLDVLDSPDLSNPLIQIKDRVDITPHSAWLTNDTLYNWAEGVTANMEAYANGKLINQII